MRMYIYIYVINTYKYAHTYIYIYIYTYIVVFVLLVSACGSSRREGEGWGMEGPGSIQTTNLNKTLLVSVFVVELPQANTNRTNRLSFACNSGNPAESKYGRD